MGKRGGRGALGWVGGFLPARVPACAGMTERGAGMTGVRRGGDGGARWCSCLRRNDGEGRRGWWVLGGGLAGGCGRG